MKIVFFYILKKIIGPYSRKGKSRILVEAYDHELIVDCIDDYLSDKLYKKLVILLDNYLDNSGVRTAFLKSLVELSDKYQIEIKLVNYLPYHSKYNQVERVWARLENMWNKMLLSTKQICIKVMEQLTWKNIIA